MLHRSPRADVHRVCPSLVQFRDVLHRSRPPDTARIVANLVIDRGRGIGAGRHFYLEQTWCGRLSVTQEEHLKQPLSRCANVPFSASGTARFAHVQDTALAPLVRMLTAPPGPCLDAAESAPILCTQLMKPRREVLTMNFCTAGMAPDSPTPERLNKAQGCIICSSERRIRFNEVPYELPDSGSCLRSWTSLRYRH